MNIKTTSAIIAVGLAVAIPSVAVMASGDEPRVAVSGNATITDEGWRYGFEGTAAGQPFGGKAFGAMRTQSGIWPTAGTCMNGGASLVVDGPGRKELAFVTVGDVCRLSDDSAFVFVGQFDTFGSTPRRFDNIQGTIDIRVTDDGHAVITAVEAG
jgi:hypothetical protein